MRYIYVATRIITYFGTELRVFWEQLVCRFFKIPQEDTRTFKSSEMCGHVEHEITDSLAASFWLCFLPFILNFLLGCCLLLTGSFRVFYIGDVSFVSMIFLWVGVSLLSNCAPSFEDALSYKDNLYKKETNIIVKILLSPHCVISYICAFLERFSLTFVLAIAFAWIYPEIVSFAFPLIQRALS